MIQLHVFFASLLLLTRDRLHTQVRQDDRGSVSLEQVVVALGLFLLATLLVAGITAVVQGRLASIV